MEKILPGEKFEVYLESSQSFGSIIPFAGEGFFLDADLHFKNGKYVAITRAPSMEGQIGIHNMIWKSSNGTTFSLYVEVTCSNGIYCDGPEYFAGGKCVKGRNPCDDPEPIPGVTCTSCVCSEEYGNITFSLVSDNVYCSACNVSNLLPCNCSGRTCGKPGACIGSCGECTTDGEYCVSGSCQKVSYLGSCKNAIPLVSDPSTIYDGIITIYGDTNNTEYVHTHQPQCNPNEGPSLFYSFTLPKRSGFDVRLQSTSGDPTTLDTVMEIRDGNCNLLIFPSSETCSDDGNPPGGVGSGLRATLPPGNYTVLVTSYNENNVGPFVLTAAFFEDQCVPACNSLTCGDTLCSFRDGTKFDCFMGPYNQGFAGDCENQGLVCRDGYCVSLNCTPNCTDKSCGADGCGGSCGTCQDGELCIDQLGICKVFGKCDHLLPYCPTKCKKNEYCGTDCQCHRVDDYYLDLTVNYDELKSSVLIETLYFTNLSCALSPDEGPCIDKEGDRRLLRLTTTVANIGMKSFAPLQPSYLYPNVYTYSSCHRHYHFNDFALFYLLDPSTGKVVKSGGKRAYCLTDSTRRHKAPWVPCDSVFGCSQQGLQPGWSDDYQNSLDCQWIDITDVKPGEYELYCFTNPVRVFNEGSFDNQGQRVLVKIPDVSTKRTSERVEVIGDLGRAPSSYLFQRNPNK